MVILDFIGRWAKYKAIPHRAITLSGNWTSRKRPAELGEKQ
jgi:hypothetical protein